MKSCVFSVAIGLVYLASAADAEEIHNYRLCRHTRCEIFDVFIEPCPEALENKPCEIPQGINASITFKYKPSFGSTIPKNRLYAETLLLDMPFMDMDPNACLYTGCPVVANVSQSWNYDLYISEDYPKRKYTVKFKIWDDEPHANVKDECCFKFDMKIV